MFRLYLDLPSDVRRLIDARLDRHIYETLHRPLYDLCVRAIERDIQTYIHLDAAPCYSFVSVCFLCQISRKRVMRHQRQSAFEKAEKSIIKD